MNQRGRGGERTVPAQELAAIGGIAAGSLGHGEEGAPGRKGGVEGVLRQDGLVLRVERGANLVLGMLSKHTESPLHVSGHGKLARSSAAIGNPENGKLDRLLWRQAHREVARDAPVFMLEGRAPRPVANGI